MDFIYFFSGDISRYKRQLFRTKKKLIAPLHLQKSHLASITHMTFNKL